MYYSVGSGGYGEVDDKGTDGERTETVHRPMQKGGYQNGATVHIQKIKRGIQRTIPKGNIPYPKRSVVE